MSRRKTTNCTYKNLHRFGLTSPEFCRVMFLSPSGETLLIASGRLTSKGNPIIKYLSADVKSTMTINNLWITYLQHWHRAVRVCAKTLCHKCNTAVINSANRMWSSCDKARVEKVSVNDSMHWYDFECKLIMRQWWCVVRLLRFMYITHLLSLTEQHRINLECKRRTNVSPAHFHLSVYAQNKHKYYKCLKIHAEHQQISTCQCFRFKMDALTPINSAFSESFLFLKK